MSRFTPGAFIAVVVLVAAACSGSVEFSFGGQSPAQAAVELIEGDAMAQRLMLGALSGAVCDDPVDEQTGTVFGCTATSGTDTVEFDVTLEGDDRIFAAPTNVVSATFLDDYATAAVQALNSENGFALAEDAMDCGTESVVLAPDRTMTCMLEDVDDGVTYVAELTVSDVNRGTFGVEILSLAE